MKVTLNAGGAQLLRGSLFSDRVYMALRMAGVASTDARTAALFSIFDCRFLIGRSRGAGWMALVAQDTGNTLPAAPAPAPPPPSSFFVSSPR